jgi:hypothetical protein
VEWNNSTLITGDIDYGSFALDEPTEAEIERRRRLGGDDEGRAAQT